RDKLIVLDNLRMDTAIQRGGGSNGHDKGTGHVLTCRSLLQGPSGVGEFGHLFDGSAGGISIDQHIANRVGGSSRFPSLVFGVKAEGLRMALPSRISYTEPFAPVIPMNNAGAAFDRIFAPLADDTVDRERKARRRRLVLDQVRGDLSRLEARLGTSDRRRVQSHIQGIDEIITRVEQIPPDPVCALPSRQSSNAYPALGQLQLDLLAKSLECDLTRVATIQWSTGQSSVAHTWVGANAGHHSISHRGNSDADARELAKRIDRWYAEQFAYLLGRLDAVEAGDGQTLLDYTTVVWVNEQRQGIGNVHRFDRMPFVLAGGGSAFNTGRFVDTNGGRHGELYVSLMNMMGIDENVFGDPDFCSGPLAL
ncbi:MAG: DUF1552 domain-containing protein, partial [Myxococcota bacterium]